MKSRKAICLLLLVLLIALDLGAGHGFHWTGGALFWQLRLPRMLAALLSGAAMALSGAQMQALFRNPLADPHIMGVSGGAGLGAALAAASLPAASFWGTSTLVGAAFLGALLSGALVVALSARVKETGTLLLSGVMLGFVLAALSSLVQYTSGHESLKLYYNWAAGSFSGVHYSGLIWMAIALLLGLALALWQRKSLDLMLFGERFAALSGVPLSRVRLVVMLGCALMTGTVTAFCGPIGFVGIAAPHLVRKTLGTSTHGVVLPWSLVYGAALALAGDILCHLGSTPLPVGSSLALIGIPLILWFLWKEKL